MRKRANPIPFALRPGPFIAAIITALFLNAAWVFHLLGKPVKVLGALMVVGGISSMVAALIAQENG